MAAVFQDSVCPCGIVDGAPAFVVLQCFLCGVVTNVTSPKVELLSRIPTS